MPAHRPPNVLLIIMDDLAWGDLACHGNPVTRTPHLDRLHAESTRLARYYSGPLCSPARASLMTGRYSYRTGVVDTYLGRSLLHGDEITLAQVLGQAGYRTGAFGKWHLGDNYPMRACDKGFEDSLMHNGGGIGQPGDYEGNSYFNPVLHRDGKPEPSTGYCTDIFGEETCRFIREHRDEPFFAYLATNCPHSPFEIDDAWVQPYRDMGVPETHARVYGMVENIDMNVGRLLDLLDELKLADDTLVIFVSDHGPCGSSQHEGQQRFNAGLRGIKGSMYDGGIRTPSLWRYPRRFAAGRDVDRIAATVDVLPTLAGLCGAKTPTDRAIDGVDLTPLLTGEQAPESWPDRTVFLQWHRGDTPEHGRNCCAIDQTHKLVNRRELYDLPADPFETTDLAGERPEAAQTLREAYDAWFADMEAERHFALPRIVVGVPEENPTVLSRNDWLGPDRDPTRPLPEGVTTIGWGDIDVGYWELTAPTARTFDARIRFAPVNEPAEVTFRLGPTTQVQPVAAGEREVTFRHIEAPAGDLRLETWITSTAGRRGARYVDLIQP